MTRQLRLLALGLLLSYASTALAESLTPVSWMEGALKKKHHRHRRGAPEETAAPAADAELKAPAPVDPKGPPGGAKPDPAAPANAAGAKGAAPGAGGEAQGNLGMDLSAPAKGPPQKGGTAPTMSFDAVDVSGKSGDRQRIEMVIRQFKDKQYEQATLSAWELMNDPKMAGSALEAQYVLAKSLYRLGMYDSSLGEFSAILARGPETKFFQTSLEWLFFISHKTTNESVILEEIAKYSNYEFPEKFRNEFRYLLARYHFVRARALDQVDRRGEAAKSYDEVKRIALSFPKKDPFFPRVKYLEGLAYFRDGDFEACLNAMKEVVRLTRPGANAKGDARQNAELRELAFMQLARTHYGVRQNRFALYYLGKIERGSPQWLESLFESAWANYRVGQYEQALGNLITLSSPFFREEYFPEALILKAVVYYENCRYRESNIILDDFNRIYGPVHDELDTLLKKDMEASEYYTVLLDIQKKDRADKNNTDIILERLLKLALTDKDLKNTNDSILELESEMDSFTRKSDAFRFSNLAKHLNDNLKIQRGNLVKKAGIMAKGKLQLELAELTKLLGNGERIRFETTGKEKEFLEAQLLEGGKAEIIRKYGYSVAVSDEQLYWPYEGEYWRDELGTYEYTLTKGCRSRSTANKVERSGGGSP